MKKAALEEHIEKLRKEINQLMDQKDTCDETKLLQISQELDEYIFQYLQMTVKK